MSLLFLLDNSLGSLSANNLNGLDANSLAASGINSSMLGSLAGLAIGMIAILFIVFIAIYVYLSLAGMRIGEKAKLGNPGIAWANFLVIVFEVAKMHWWPWAMTAIGIMLGYLVLIAGAVSLSAGFSLVGSAIIGIIALIFLVMIIIWHWKMFEAMKKPGWWIIIPVVLAIIGFFCLIATVLSPIMILIGILLWIIAAIIYLVFVGIAAWGK